MHSGQNSELAGDKGQGPSPLWTSLSQSLKPRDLDWTGLDYGLLRKPGAGSPGRGWVAARPASSSISPIIASRD